MSDKEHNCERPLPNLLELSADLNYLLQGSVLSDFSLCVNGTDVVCCHKDILRYRSRWFNAHIQQAEARGVNQIALTENKQILEAVLFYIYSGNLRHLESMDISLLDLYQAAKTYGLMSLERTLARIVKEKKVHETTNALSFKWKIKVEDYNSVTAECSALNNFNLCGTDKWKLQIKPMLQTDDVEPRLGIYISRQMGESCVTFNTVLFLIAIIDSKGASRSSFSTQNTFLEDAHIEIMGNEPLQRIVQELGGWPAVDGDKWNSANFDWMEALFALRKVGFGHNIFLSVSIGPDIRNNTRHIVDLDQASLGMPDRNYLLKGVDDPLVSAYYQLMVDSAVLLGANKTKAEEEMKAALLFEISMANFSVPREERRNISRLYNKMTVDDLYKLAPQLNWDKYFNKLLMNKIPRSEEIIVIVPDYVQNLEKLLLSTDKRVIANYLMWRVVGQAFPTLHRAWGEISQHYSSILTGKVRQEARWEHCLGTLSGSLSTALASLYVRHHFQDGSKDLALEMVNYIHREFLHILSNVDWMDSQTKERAREKAQNMATYIGYPNELLEELKVSEIYDGLHVNSSSYFENVRTLRKWATDYVLSKLRKPNVKGDWKKRSAAAVVNAFYNSIENSIEFPAGILQGVFFSKDRPNYLNFGAIGFVIGHEITHGFDDRGRQFDKDGNNINWWETETDSTFRERAQCIIDQYGNYSIDEVGLQVNGINTQGENIADNGGIKEAFRAYLQWIRDHGAEDYLPGIKYSPTQLFWISAANVWCGKYRPEVLKLRIMTGSHSPAPYRVIGPLANTPEFAAEFGCPLGSPMNPVKKCSVW